MSEAKARLLAELEALTKRVRSTTDAKSTPQEELVEAFVSAAASIAEGIEKIAERPTWTFDIRRGGDNLITEVIASPQQ